MLKTLLVAGGVLRRPLACQAADAAGHLRRCRPAGSASSKRPGRKARSRCTRRSPRRTCRSIIKPFEAKYGIKVNVWRAGTDKVLQRTLAEAAAKRDEVDVVHFGSARDGSAVPREGAAAGEVAHLQGPDARLGAGAPAVGGDAAVGLGPGLQHQPDQEGRPAQDLRRPAGPAAGRASSGSRPRTRTGSRAWSRSWAAATRA